MADDRMAVLDTVRTAISDGDVDFLREGVRVLAQAIMEVEVGELTGAAKGERSPDTRLTHRNGYRERRWDTRVGTIDLAIPRVRDGSYLPSLFRTVGGDGAIRIESGILDAPAYVEGWAASLDGRSLPEVRDQIGEIVRVSP